MKERQNNLLTNLQPNNWRHCLIWDYNYGRLNKSRNLADNMFSRIMNHASNMFSRQL